MRLLLQNITPQHTRRICALILGALMVCAGLYRFSFDYISVLGAFLFFIIVPGVCISAWVFRDSGELLERMGAAFGFGIAFSAVFFLIRGLVRFPTDYFQTAPLLSAIVLLLVFITVYYGKTRRSLQLWFRMDEVAFGPPICVMLLGVVLLLNENVLLLTSDSLVYIAQMGDWQHKGEFGVDLVDLKTLLGRLRLYRMVIQPLFLHVTGILPAVQYQILVSIIGVFFASSFYMFNKRIYNSKPFLLISVLMFVFYFGGFWFNAPNINYSWFVAWSLYFISCAFLLDFLDDRHKSKLVVAIIIAFCTLLIHASFFLVTLLSVLSFIVFIIATNKSLSRWLRYSVMAFVGSITIGTLLLYGIDVLCVKLPMLDHWGVYRSGDHFRGHLSAFGAGYIVNPSAGPALFMGLWGLLSIAFLPVIVRNRHRLKKNVGLFLISNTIFPLAILFNPLLVSVMLALVTSDGVERLIFAVPHISIVALTMALCIQEWRENPEHARTRLKAIGIVSLVLLAGLPVFIYRILLLMPYDWGYKAQPFLQGITGLPTGPFRYNHAALIRALEFVRTEIRPEATFLTDPITAELFPVFLENPVLEQWRSALLNKEIASSTSMKVLGPDLNAVQSTGLLMRKKIDFVLINNSWNSYAKAQYFGSSSERDVTVFDVQKFREHPECFRLLFEDHDILIFLFVSENAKATFNNQGVLQTLPLLLLLRQVE